MGKPQTMGPALAEARADQPLVAQQPMSETQALISMVERAAANPEVDVEKMERLVAMRNAEIARVALLEYNEALNKAQGEMGRIKSDKKNSHTGSWYATFASLDRTLRPIYVANGFSITWSSRVDGAQPNCIIVTGKLAHRGGHTEDFEIEMPADGKGPKGDNVMTRTHATGSGFTYGKRYLLKGMFNIAEAEEIDDDGNAAGAHISGADESKADAFYQRIKEADNVVELKKVGADIAGSGLPPLLLRRVRATYTARLDKLREQEKARG